MFDQTLIRICLILGSLITAGYILRRVRQAKVQIEDTIFWLLFSAALLILAIFPGIAYWAANLLGFMSPINFVYVVIIFLLLAKQFFMSIKLSQLDSKVRILTEKKYTFSAGAGFFPKLAYASEIELIDAVPADAAKMASVVTGDAQIYMPMGDLIDFEAERARLGKEKSKVEADIAFVMKKLNNPKFVDKAPEKVVAAEREKAEKLREHLAKLEESIAALN